MTEPKLRVLSLGWGVQSWTIAAMCALGELPPVDYAVHADTTHEHEATYAHARRWTPWLRERGVKVVTVEPNRPNVVDKNWNNAVLIPAFLLNPTSGEVGPIRRECTHDWKIAPIRQYLRTLLPKPRPGDVDMLMGISLDEWPRMRSSNVKYIENSYPLVDKRISRSDCVAWLNEHGLDIPPKSGCVFCPYTTIPRWKTLKRADGSDWRAAVAVDAAIRDLRSDVGRELFVHRACKPLPEAVNIPEDYGAHQMELGVPCDSGHCFT